MKEKVLLFEFGDLGVILQLQKLLAPLSIDVECISRSDYGCRLEDLVAGKREKGSLHAALGGQMAVLCVPVERVQSLLVLMRAAGVGQNCLKAVLTPHNRAWTPAALYAELVREHRAMQRR